ncbi:MAG: multidrug ABC transporter permease [Chlorobiaceae bacterium]|nr:multidrug ABC transporter permease [Chlorobiaceae bacterium]
MKIPLKYITRNLKTRRLTTTLTVVGISLVVFVFAAVLMMAHGIQKTLIQTGSDENVIVLRKAATAEITSIIMQDQANVVQTIPSISKLSSGKPFISNEVVTIINLPYSQKESGLGNVTVRGVAPEGFQLRQNMKLTGGRFFNWGSREIIVGSSIKKRFKGTEIGNKIKFGGDEWMIVGSFDAGGNGFDSEIWGDQIQLSQSFGYTGAYSSLLIRLDNVNAFTQFQEAFNKDLRLQTLDVKREKKFYEEQSEDMAMFIRILGIAITVIFSLGAMIGAMITMYAAVSNRTIEIGTLRALGFQRRNVLFAFLIESLSISIFGGLIGLFLASFLQFFDISMINFGSFAELAFSFSLSPSIIINSLIFTVVMGLVGGFLPSIRASRLNIVNALRSS